MKEKLSHYLKIKHNAYCIICMYQKRKKNYHCNNNNDENLLIRQCKPGSEVSVRAYQFVEEDVRFTADDVLR